MERDTPVESRPVGEVACRFRTCYATEGPAAGAGGAQLFGDRRGSAARPAPGDELRRAPRRAGPGVGCACTLAGERYISQDALSSALLRNTWRASS
ncbi:hypothetical protein ACPA9J_07825 [Pseudomonas aeruginosa]